MPDKAFPSDKADKFVIRLPDGMREKIKNDADQQGRSMNAQIVFMLQEYFNSKDDEFNELKNLASESQSPTNEISTLNIVLDTNGQPISWNEVFQHIQAINSLINAKVIASNTVVQTPEIVSSFDRVNEASELHDFYKNKITPKKK